MPDTGFLLLSVVCVVIGSAFILFPDPLLRLSGMLNRTLATLDHKLMRHRYLIAAFLFAASYLLFRVSLLLLEFRG